MGSRQWASALICLLPTTSGLLLQQPALCQIAEASHALEAFRQNLGRHLIGVSSERPLHLDRDLGELAPHSDCWIPLDLA